MSISTRHRWYPFGLRTLLFGVTLLALPLGWAGYSLNWIRQRQEARKVRPVIAFTSNETPLPHVRAPGGLWLFGEEGVEVVFLDSETDEESAKRIGRLFPESRIQK